MIEDNPHIFNHPQTVQYTETTLPVKQFCYSTSVLLEDLLREEQIGGRGSIEVLKDVFASQAVFHFRRFFAVHELETLHVKYPEDWWQAFRERWLPPWWLLRHPVKYRHIKLSAEDIWYKRVLSEGESVVKLVKTDETFLYRRDPS